jgi:hypothetical protein
MDRRKEIELLEADVFSRIEKEVQKDNYCGPLTSVKGPDYGENRQEKKEKLKKLFEIMAELKAYEREYDKVDSLQKTICQ